MRDRASTRPGPKVMFAAAAQLEPAEVPAASSCSTGQSSGATELPLAPDVAPFTPIDVE